MTGVARQDSKKHTASRARSQADGTEALLPVTASSL
jgi:hypothetical protein